MSFPASNPTAVPWWRLFNRHHWFVFSVASLAWLFDCLDQQLFNLARDSARETLVADKVRAAGLWVSLVLLLGLAVLPFLPETKDQPLPEE